MYRLLRKMSPQVSAVDLQELALPFCDGGSSYHHPDAQKVSQFIARATGIILATPIYSYDVAATARNLVQLTGSVWARKVVGFVCVAGGPINYSSVLGLANTLMLDYRTFVLPDFVFAGSECFDDENSLVDAGVVQQLQQLASTLVRVTEALKTA
jgi:FMN reductase